MKILITGGSDGIGLEVAKILAAQKNEITLVARDKDKLQRAISSLQEGNHRMIVADLNESDAINFIKENIASNKYDVLINNAGMGMYGRFHEMDLADQLKMLDLNITALTKLSHFYLSSATNGCALVNVASVLGTSTSPGAAAYAASKAYVSIFSESLWFEFKSKGIYVMSFCPGLTYTNFHNSSGADKNNIPRFIMQSAEQAAGELVRGLKHRSKPRVVSGGLNRFMLFFQKLLSRKMVATMMGQSTLLK